MCTLCELGGVCHLPFLPLGHSESQVTKAAGHRCGLVILPGVRACEQQSRCTLGLMKEASRAPAERTLILTRNPAIS